MGDQRRSVAHPTPDFHQNARSGIPIHVPSTAKKPLPNQRMSLAGPALRAPYQTPASSSRMRPLNSSNLLQSVSKQNYGRTPLRSSARRGSVWSGAVTLGPQSSNQNMKDPRPLRDKPYQAKMKHDIHIYLQESGFDIPRESLSSMTGKDYRMIFEFLVLRLDPSHPFNPNARFEDHFVPALKSLQYPFAHQIDNKWLATPAAPHSWPFLLGVLHWLAELCKLREHYLNSGHLTLQTASDVTDEFDDPADHRTLAFEFYSQAYSVWLDLIDDLSESKQYLEEKYAKKNEGVQKDIEELTKSVEDANAVLKKLKSSAAPLAKLENENKLLKGDSEKFQKILQQYEERKKRLTDKIAYEKSELEKGYRNLDEMKQELEKLANIVKTQNLSAEEVVRMTTDHEILSRNLEDLRQKVSESHKIVLNLEVSVTNRAEAAEDVLESYTNLISSLGLFPPLLPPFEGINLILELNTASSDPQQLLTGADIRRIIKPTLSRIAESTLSQRATVENERDRIDDEFDRLTLECENIEEEIGEVEKKVIALNQQADDYRDAAQQEAMVANAEAARLERETANARTAALAKGMGVKTRLQALQFDYREQIERASRLKDETVRAIIKNSHDIAMFKAEVSRHLRELREFAETI